MIAMVLEQETKPAYSSLPVLQGRRYGGNRPPIGAGPVTTGPGAEPERFGDPDRLTGYFERSYLRRA